MLKEERESIKAERERNNERINSRNTEERGMKEGGRDKKGKE